jgi:hypothetical protein
VHAVALGFKVYTVSVLTRMVPYFADFAVETMMLFACECTAPDAPVTPIDAARPPATSSEVATRPFAFQSDANLLVDCVMCCISS